MAFKTDGRKASGTFEVISLSDDDNQDTQTAVFEADCSRSC